MTKLRAIEMCENGNHNASKSLLLLYNKRQHFRLVGMESIFTQQNKCD